MHTHGYWTECCPWSSPDPYRRMDHPDGSIAWPIPFVEVWPSCVEFLSLLYRLGVDGSTPDTHTMETKYRTLLQAAVMILILAVVVINHSNGKADHALAQHTSQAQP